MLNRTTIAELRIDHDTPLCYKIDGSPVMINRWTKEMLNKKYFGKQTMNRIELMAVGFLIAVLTGCSSDPEPLEISNVLEIDATVVAVDAQERTLVLRGPEGNEMGFRVGPDVRNLSQVEAGDTLRVSYYTGYLVSMSEPGNVGSDAKVAAARAAEGERPGAMVGATLRATVEILSIAKDGKSVSFRDAEGRLQTIPVHREDAQAFVRKLDKGDLVDIRYSEAIAVNVEPAESGS